MFYDVVDNFADKRMPFREPHLKLVKEAHERGEIVMAGGLGDPLEQAMIVFRVADASTPEDFARNDPYVKQGLVKNWRVKAWNVVVGGAQ